MNLNLSTKSLQNFYQSSKLEWLETNGKGGWASASVNGSNSRKYHGLLVAATKAPHGRYVMLSKLDEQIVTARGQFPLHTNKYRDTIFPHGYQYLKSFTKNLFPEFTYEVDGIILKKTIAATHGEQSTLLIYEVLEADHEFTLELNPLVAGRNYHHLAQANGQINPAGAFANGVLQYQPYDQLPEMYISVPGSEFVARPDWYHHFEYLQDKERGEGCEEDLFSPGNFKITMRQGDRLGIIISTENPHFKNVFHLFEKERARRQSLLTSTHFHDEFYWKLILAADQFMVQDEQETPSIIAGYHWFTERSRDALIALPGLCLSTNRWEEARKILSSYADRMHKGLLPCRYADDGLDCDYTSVDAPLWFFNAIEHYYNTTKDISFVQHELLPAMRQVIQYYQSGTLYNIRMDKDGLLSAGDFNLNLTWMDARHEDRPYSPRPGKAVEVNALWYNALKVYEKFMVLIDDQREALHMASLSAKVRKSFLQTFWCQEANHLYDYVDGNYCDKRVRPNQLMAIGLHHAVLEGEKALAVFEAVNQYLLSPAGIRSLGKDTHGYRPNYTGVESERNYAYHHGVIWHWLLGPYLDAAIKLQGRSAMHGAHKIFNYLRKQLLEAGIGTLSEIADAERPYLAKGCIARAISVAELLRVGTAYGLFEKEKILNLPKDQEILKTDDLDVADGKEINYDMPQGQMRFTNPFSMISAFRSGGSRLRWLRHDLV